MSACLGMDPSKSDASTTKSTTARLSFCRAIFLPTFFDRSKSGSAVSA